MLITSCTSFFILFLLAWMKFIVAFKVDSRSMRIDGMHCRFRISTIKPRLSELIGTSVNSPDNRKIEY